MCLFVRHIKLCSFIQVAILCGHRQLAKEILNFRDTEIGTSVFIINTHIECIFISV